MVDQRLKEYMEVFNISEKEADRRLKRLIEGYGSKEGALEFIEKRTYGILHNPVRSSLIIKDLLGGGDHWFESCPMHYAT